MQVLVVGGAGYIGSHVVLDLLAAGHEVTVFDDLSTGCRENIFPESTFVQGDLQDIVLLEKTFSEGDFQGVVHLAALKAAGDSMHEPERYSVHNLNGGVHLINAAAKAGVRYFVFSSSAAVYGEPDYLPIDEQHPIQPTNFYGFTKLQLERQLAWFSQLRHMRFASLRYFNAAGYDVAGRVKGLERNPKNLIPVVMEVATGARGELAVFGNDYETRDGTCVRDYIHVNDLADAHTRALSYMAEHGKDLTVNLGSELGLTVLEVLRAAEAVVGKPIAHKMAERRAGDPAVLVASAAKATELLGWQPRYSDLDTLIRTTWKAYGG